MTTLLRRSLRAAIPGAVVAARCAVTAPVHATTTSPPIYDPLRPIKEKVNDLPDADDVTRAVSDSFAAGGTGDCLFQGAAIEGFGASGGVAETTGIVCRVYDASGALRGGCSVFLSGSSASCAAPTDVVIGPPRVCTEVYSKYTWGTLREEHCN